MFNRLQRKLVAGRVKLARVARLSVLDWRYLLIAVKELFLARIRHGTQPISKILHDLQDMGAQSQLGAEIEVHVARLSWAIGAAAARVPWRSDCLLRVMAADRWLRRSQLQPDFFLGVRKDHAGQFTAHAWLRCNGLMVASGQGEEFVTLISPSRQT